MPDALSFFVVAAACTAAAAGQAWFFPWGREKAEPRARRTALAATSLLVILGAILIAHLLLPAHPMVAAALGAVAGVLIMKAVRAAAGSAPTAR